MHTLDIIHKKRLGEAHTEAEIGFLIDGYVAGRIPDYQISAWLMAVLWRGLTDPETFALTTAMVQSGETLDLSSLPGPCLDKHSTGGVGDKTTLAVVPILASAGVQMPKMSGRGLGHTGGTLDKLESVGARVSFTVDEILAQVRAVGACVCAQTETLVPADRKMYALRDATDTVQSLPLIAASILSKKIAGGCPAIVLDVKVGGGAFMKTLPEARALAALMLRIGTARGRAMAAVLSDMDAPLGRAIGNRLEVREVARLLAGDADPRLLSLTLTLAGASFLLTGKATTLDAGRALASAQIESGAAAEKLREIITAQGGDVALLNATPNAAVVREVRAARGGWVSGIDAEAIGRAAMRLGAGRETKEETIDPEAGIVLGRVVGEAVTAGDVLATLYTERGGSADAEAKAILDCFALTDPAPDPRPVLLEIIGLEPIGLDT